MRRMLPNRLRVVGTGICALMFACFLISPGEGAKTVVTDQAGREVVIEGPIERIVTIPIPAASMVLAVDGSSEKLVGMNPLSKTAMEGEILSEFFPEALKIRSDIVQGEGFQPNVETLMSLAPDIVFQWGNFGDNLYTPLLNAGMKVALFKYGTQEYLEGWIETFGAILGKQEKSATILDWHRKTREQLSKRSGAIPDSEKPRTLYFLRFLANYQVAGKNTHNDVSIALAGGKNVAAEEIDGFAAVNEEQILLWDPEVILLNGFERDLSPDHVYTNERLKGVSAVRNRRVYKLPLGGYRWDPPNQETPLMWMWMSAVLHPGRDKFDLAGEMERAYGLLYGRALSRDQYDHILLMEKNRGSAHYDALFGRAK